MKFLINSDIKKITVFRENKSNFFNLYSSKAFKIISNFWLEYIWNQKYTYRFTWLGFPIIQLPDDIINIQELIFKERPDYVVETGVAHGGSIIFYASLLKILNKGKVIGIEKEFKKKNLDKLKKNFLKKYFELIESDSTNKDLIRKLKRRLDGKKVIIILDSNHSYHHVFKELNLYSEIIKKGSYIIVTDGIIDVMKFAPRRIKYQKNYGPLKAINEFLLENNKFKKIQPINLFNESKVFKNISHWPDGWLKKLKN